MPKDYRLFFKLFADVTKAIHRGDDLQEITANIARHAADILAASGSMLWKVDTVERRVENLAAYGSPFSTVLAPDYPALERLLATCRNNVVFIENFSSDERLADTPFSGCVDGGSLTAAVIDSVSGACRLVLAVWNLTPGPMERERQDLLMAFAEQGALAVYRSLHGGSGEADSARQIVEGLAMALEAKDEQTHGHSLRVALFARRVGAELGFREDGQGILYHGGLLHDIGKIGVANAILLKLGVPTLSAGEKDVVRRHPEIGVKILSPLKSLHELLPMVLHHHERFDGTGFPAGLANRRIPFTARVITVCDAFETMLSGRKHLAAIPLADAVAELERGAGRQFDPVVVQALFSALGKVPEEFIETGFVPPNLEEILTRLSRRIALRGNGADKTSAEIFI